MPTHLSEAPFASEADHRACAAAIRGGSRTFYLASWLLPSAVSRPAFALYAFCRLYDDAIDLEGGEAEALARLKARLDQIYAGRPHDHPADRAFADVARDHDIPRAVPEALIEGLSWDCEGRRYATLEELHAYAARVAGTVGVMMAILMGVRDRQALSRACDLGIAMQLTNIARDVGEDARAGRIYLPLEWLKEAGLDADAFLAAPKVSPALAATTARLLGAADQLYDRAREGVARLPLSCRPGILAAAAIYAEIGREVERQAFDSVTARARVGAARKLVLLTGAALQTPTLSSLSSGPALPAASFLIDAAARANPARAARYSPKAHALRVLEIFERLERADQPGK